MDIRDIFPMEKVEELAKEISEKCKIPEGDIDPETLFSTLLPQVMNMIDTSALEKSLESVANQVKSNEMPPSQ